MGPNIRKYRKRLLVSGEQLTLEEAIDIARTYEATQSQMEELDGKSNKNIHGIKTRARTRQRHALTEDLIIIYSLERSVPHMALCA